MHQVICPHCSSPNRPGARMCSACGKPLSQVPAPQQLPPRPQPPGGPPGAPQAGQQLSGWPGQPPAGLPGQPVGYPSPAAARPGLFRRLPRWAWIAIGVLVVAALVVSIIALLPSEGKTDGAVGPSETPAGAVISPTATLTAVPASPIPMPVEVTPEAEAAPTPEPLTVEPPTPTPPVPIANLLTNGDFSQEWTVGWVRRFGPEATGSQTIETMGLDRGSAGRAVYLERTGPDTLEIRQTVSINPAQMDFSAQFRLAGEALEPAAEKMGVGALMLIYHGSDPNAPPLGWSLWVNGERRDLPILGQEPLPPLGNNVALHWTGDDWISLELDLRQEIINRLLVINPDDVRQVTVVLLAAGTVGCAPAECYTEVTATDLFLTQE